MSRDFLIDTNVLSELMRTQPDFQVMNWFELHGDASCFTSSITKAEIFLGIALLPESKRRNRLTEAAEKMFSTDFSERCLPFDNQSAINYAILVSQRLRIGKPVSTEDAQIAAIAVTNNLVLVTRNTKDFPVSESGRVSLSYSENRALFRLFYVRQKLKNKVYSAVAMNGHFPLCSGKIRKNIYTSFIRFFNPIANH